jgi:GNAT superfamily N-acetyltransferase
MLDIVADRPAAADVIAAEPHRARRIFSTLALAFAADPPSRWLFPEPESYLQHFPGFARALSGPSLQRRTAFAIADYAAVALMLPPGDGPDEETMADLIDEEVHPDRKDDFAEVIEEMSRYHPLEPHWYIPLIGVEPSRQGQGLGSALLRRSLARVDADGLSAYLESTIRATAPSMSATASKPSVRSGSAPVRPSSRCSGAREAEMPPISRS